MRLLGLNLRDLAPRVRDTYVEAFARGESALDAAGLLVPLRLAHFLAQVCHETGGLSLVVESLHYSAERLTKVWPARFPTLASAAPFAGKPEALADRVYGGRMGNVHPGDGHRYIGRGLLQITGRDNYTRIGKGLGLDLVGCPALAGSADHAVAVAVAVWQAAGCSIHADADDIVKVTRAINGGTHGLDDRRAWLAKAKARIAGVA